MPVSPAYRPDPRFAALGDAFSDVVAPASFPQHLTRHRHDRAAASVGLETLTDEEWVAHMGRFEPLPGNMSAPRAMRYHGHQFRNYNPDIGDGRGFLFAQMRDHEGRLLDLGTKGSGQTPYSRFGDGRLTLKGGVREVLASSLLEARGVDTSKALSLIETGEALERNDEPSPTRSAVLVRLSHGHIRFGTFQRHAFHQDAEALDALRVHVRDCYLPEAVDAPSMLAAAARNLARTCAGWMAAGFVHGVLNTDNVTVTGESFDYGPWRFLPRFEPGFTAAYFDHGGLYAFGRQPEACFWNCRALAAALTPLAAEDDLAEALRAFEPAYRDALRRAVLGRLGIGTAALEDDLALVRSAFTLLETTGQAWEPFFLRWFGGRLRDGTPAPEEAAWAAMLAERTPARPERLHHPYFAREAPVDLLIEEVEALWEAIDERDDWRPLAERLTAIEAARQAHDFPRNFDASAADDGTA